MLYLTTNTPCTAEWLNQLIAKRNTGEISDIDFVLELQLNRVLAECLQKTQSIPLQARLRLQVADFQSVYYAPDDEETN